MSDKLIKDIIHTFPVKPEGFIEVIKIYYSYDHDRETRQWKHTYKFGQKELINFNNVVGIRPSTVKDSVVYPDNTEKINSQLDCYNISFINERRSEYILFVTEE